MFILWLINVSVGGAGTCLFLQKKKNNNNDNKKTKSLESLPHFDQWRSDKKINEIK